MTEPTDTDAATAEWGGGLSRVAAPLREQVLVLMRNAILDFSLKPGERLVERELVERIGVSRTTIREVMRDLTSEGLVTVNPQKGAIVSQLSAEEAADIYEVRASIEGIMVQRFVERASDELIAQARDAVEEFARVVESGGDILAMLAAKDRFYGTVSKGAGSPTLKQILSGLQARVQSLRAKSLSVPGRPEEAVVELRALGDAIVARDAERASRLAGTHVRSAADSGARHAPRISDPAS